MIYSNDPYLGITKPLPLFEAKIYPIDKVNQNNFVEVQLFKKGNEFYYGVTLYNNKKTIYIGKYIRNNNLFSIKYKNGNILLYNENFNHQKGRMNIVEVLGLYNITDDTFYYCSEADAIRLFDSNIDLDDLQKPNKKILRTGIRNQIYKENEFVESKETENNVSSDSPKVLKLI